MSFTFTHTPDVYFGAGKIKVLSDILAAKNSRNVLLISGGSSFKRSSQYEWLNNELTQCGIPVYAVTVTGEPSPDLIDCTAAKYRDRGIDMVIAVGGGSVIDAGKAISAILTQNEPVMMFLEGTKEGRKHNGKKVPFIAIPTTSGTGSEATKNAVLGRIGENGFKSSLRHDNFVPDIAIIDPELTVTCPPNVTASSGMDALCQLIGSYMSAKAGPITDALALDGIEKVRDSLEAVCTNEPDNIEKRARMSYAAFISGITLANAGLGVVHGFASVIGGLFSIPHGVICGTLLPEAVRVNISELAQNKTDNALCLYKYARIGEILTGTNAVGIEKKCFVLIDYLDNLKRKLNLPGLGSFGVTERHAHIIAGKASNKNNPVKLNEEQLKQIVINCL